nr:MAG TPA: hypothetical protein [Crassvirales sp.]
MDIMILITVLLFCTIWPMFRHYEPKIEVVVLISHYRVYLWYNAWDGPCYKGRVYKYLFEI